MNLSRSIEFLNGLLIDIDQIEAVGPLYGDDSWKRYKIYTKSCREYEIYEAREFTGTGVNKESVAQMSRKDLIHKLINMAL